MTSTPSPRRREKATTFTYRFEQGGNGFLPLATAQHYEEKRILLLYGTVYVRCVQGCSKWKGPWFRYTVSRYPFRKRAGKRRA